MYLLLVSSLGGTAQFICQPLSHHDILVVTLHYCRSYVTINMLHSCHSSVPYFYAYPHPSSAQLSSIRILDLLVSCLRAPLGFEEKHGIWPEGMHGKGTQYVDKLQHIKGNLFIFRVVI